MTRARGLLLLAALLLPAPAARSAEPPYATLLDAPDFPLPPVRVTVPDLSDPAALDIIADLPRPTIFLIYAAPDDPHVAAFAATALEYRGIAHFRTVAATSAAARKLYAKLDAGEPIYLAYDPARPLDARLSALDLANAPSGYAFDQAALEAFIANYASVSPHRPLPPRLTTAGTPVALASGPPLVVLFHRRSDGGAEPALNRLRMLLGIEQDFLPGVRFVEADPDADPRAYAAVAGERQPLPAEPELWLFEPATQRAVRFAPLAATLDLTQDALQGWLAALGIPKPVPAVLEIDAGAPDQR